MVHLLITLYPNIYNNGNGWLQKRSTRERKKLKLFWNPILELTDSWTTIAQKKSVYKSYRICVCSK